MDPTPLRCLFLIGFPTDGYFRTCARLIEGFDETGVPIEYGLLTALPADPPCYVRWNRPPRTGRLRTLLKIREWLRDHPRVRIHPIDLARYAPGPRSQDLPIRLPKYREDPFLRSVHPSLVDLMNDEACYWPAWDPAEVRRHFEEADRFEQAARDAVDRLAPDLVVVQQDLNFYEGRFVWEHCRARGIPCFGLGLSYLTPFVREETRVNEIIDVVTEGWERLPDRKKFSPETGRRVMRRYKEIQHQQMNHTRSYDPQTLRGRPGQKTVALLLSAAFERYSEEFEPAFPNQEDLVRRVRALFVGRDDARLIIRPHPIDAPASLARFRAVLSESPDTKNVLFLDDPRFNTYDLLPVMDLGLVAFSEMGLELMAHGIPVLYGARVVGANCAFANRPPDAETYLSMLQGFLDGTPMPRPDPEEIFSYLAYFNHVVSDGVEDWPYYPPPVIHRPVEMARRLLARIPAAGVRATARVALAVPMSRSSWRRMFVAEMLRFRPRLPGDRVELREALAFLARRLSEAARKVHRVPYHE